MSETHPDELIDPEWANPFGSQGAQERTVLDVLRGVPIFSLLSQDDLERLTRVVHVRNYAPGEVVVRAGLPQSGFHVIRTGSVEIVRQRPGGAAEVVDVLGPGELLGEFGLLDNTPRSSSLVAAEPSELIGFFQPDLMGILDTRPRMACRILLRLGEEMTRALHRDYAALRATGFSGTEEDKPMPAAHAQAV
jgi:CRP/FNR family transcriptional regulator, cyclic AMP receptor protein